VLLDTKKLDLGASKVVIGRCDDLLSPALEADIAAVGSGLGRIVVSENEAPSLLAHLVWSG
jgi:hypothetical protein